MSSPQPPVLSRAWYREPWPWILMAGPAAVVVAGFVTLALAVTSFDGLVADDYYRQGLGVNRDIARDERAGALGVSAAVHFNADRSEVRVVLSPRGAAGASLRLRLVHPTRAGEDQSIVLAATTPGAYAGGVAPLRQGHWRLSLEDPAGTWRVAGDWSAAQDATTLASHPRADVR